MTPHFFNAEKCRVGEVVELWDIWHGARRYKVVQERKENGTMAKRLRDLKDSVGGLIRWVTDDGLECVIPDDAYWERPGPMKSTNYFFVAFDCATADPFILKLTEGAAKKLSLKWEPKKVFHFVQVENREQQVRYKVKATGEELTDKEFAAAQEEIKKAKIDEKALDEALSKLGS